jgi:3-dehydroquinate synthase
LSQNWCLQGGGSWYLPSGEKTKSFKQTEKTPRLDAGGMVSAATLLVFAVGGGVIGDITGFCASIAMRGVKYIQVPTTLLAQVDSSVGGKTGINTRHGKNLDRQFLPARRCCRRHRNAPHAPAPRTARWLRRDREIRPYRQYRFLQLARAERRQCLQSRGRCYRLCIEASVKAKAITVQADEKETGARALLNLGHTFGHALETAAKYDGRLLHGEAVAIGIVMAFDLSSRMGLCPRADYERVEQHFLEIGLPTRASFIEPGINTSVEDLLEIMSHDKKSTGGKLKFILARGIGEAFVTSDVPEDLVREVLKDSLGEDARTGARGVKGKWKSAFSFHS